MRQSTRFAASVSVLTLIALAGCGSSFGSSGGSSGTTAPSRSGGSGSGKKKIDVCKIVNTEDAATVGGGPVEVQAPSGTESLSSGVCIYRGTGGGIRVSLLQARVYPGPQFYGDKALSGTKSIDISGADKAFV